jgi:aminopeptidase N
VTLDFSTTVPVQPRQSYGIFAIQPGSGTWALAHWFPLLAGVDASGWNLDPVSVNGDPIFSNAALFDVSLTAPAEMTLVTSGHLTASARSAGNVRWHFIAGPVRDFTIVADDDFTFTSRQVGATVVTSFYHPDDAAAGTMVLAYAVRAMTLFSRLYGTYPFQELNLVEVSLHGAAGVEFPKLLFVGDNLYASSLADDPHYLEFVTAHEVAHQWWYGVVGNNQYVHAFLDEGLAEYDSTMVYFTHEYGASLGGQQFDRSIKLWYFNTLFSSGDLIVDEPTDEFPNEGAYGAIVYAKGALGFDAIHRAIGDDAFSQGLRAYYERHKFGIATPIDLRTSFEEASGKNLGELWRHWFQTADGRQDFTEADYQRLQQQLSTT